MSKTRPHRGLHPHIRALSKTGLGLFNSRGWKPGEVVEVEIILPTGRPAFLQINVCGERNMLVNVYVPRAWPVSSEAEPERIGGTQRTGESGAAFGLSGISPGRAR